MLARLCYYIPTETKRGLKMVRGEWSISEMWDAMEIMMIPVLSQRLKVQIIASILDRSELSVQAKLMRLKLYKPVGV